MSVGRTGPSEYHDYNDPISGTPVRRLTNYLAHSHHIYFTNSGWYNKGLRLLFGSDRENRSNLFSLELATGTITQLTDFAPVPPPREVCFLNTAVNPTKDEAYFWYDRRMIALDLSTLKMRTLWETPPEFARNMLTCTADGKYICAGLYEDLSGRIHQDLGRGYIGFNETWEARPLSRIVKVAVDGSKAETIWEEQTWIAHVNTSPTQPHLITFCHEGPWERVDNRIWGMDLNSGKVWKIRPRKLADESIGHEHWHADGLHVGYHGYHGLKSEGRKFLGRVRYDNTDDLEADFPHDTGHVHSNSISLIVGHAGDAIRLWRWNGKGFDGPRRLCTQRCSSHVQKLHVHPRFHPEGTHVLYTSDESGYGNMYLAEMRDFDSLPKIEGK